MFFIIFFVAVIVAASVFSRPSRDSDNEDVLILSEAFIGYHCYFANGVQHLLLVFFLRLALEYFIFGTILRCCDLLVPLLVSD